MPLVYPTLDITSFKRTLEFRTNVQAAENGTEQRWPLTPGEERFELGHTMLTLTERDQLISFFDTAKGSFDQTLQLTFNSLTFSGLRLDDDSIDCTEDSPGRWSVSVAMRQTYRVPDVGSVPSTFPALSTGAKMQLPYTFSKAALVSAVQTEGARFTRYRRATTLRTWTAGGTVLTDTEAQAIWDMFRFARGRWLEFGFTDPDSSTAYTHCRFADDTLEWKYTPVPDVNEVKTRITQIS